MSPVAEHPLLRKFWNRIGVQWAAHRSDTEDDYAYSVQLDERQGFTLTEERHCHFSGQITETNTVHGRWEAVHLAPDQVMLRLTDVDDPAAAGEMVLVISAQDISYGPAIRGPRGPQ